MLENAIDWLKYSSFQEQVGTWLMVVALYQAVRIVLLRQRGKRNPLTKEATPS